MSQLCADCEWMQKDNDLRPRCYSPQLRRLGTPGIPVTFERDSIPEPDRSHADGTGKCGAQKLNWKQREAI
jgi:hypothetical protein